MELTYFQKGEIVALRDSMSHREIGDQLGIPHRTVSSFLEHYNQCKSTDNFPRPGAPRNSLRPIFITLSVLRSQRPECYSLKYWSTPLSPMSLLHEQFVGDYAVAKKAYENGKQWAQLY